MANCIMVGCDLHDKSMLLRIAVDREAPVTRTLATDPAARARVVQMLQELARRHGARRIVLAYEACGLGFRWCDQLRAAGIECHVLAPTGMERSVKHRRRKTDEQDAQKILDYVKSYLLAGVALPAVWVPDRQTRDDRELTRHRLTMGEELTRCKNRIHWLLKRHDLRRPECKAWTEEHRGWLRELAERGLPWGASCQLSSLLRQLEWLEAELERLDQLVLSLSKQARHAARIEALRGRNKGVGVLTALVYLTELGDLARFENRRQVGNYLGLAPSSHESGQASDRKGHITHQGPARVRKVLCQAVWSRLRAEPTERARYDRLVARNPKHKKIAVVARMRVLAVCMWHDGQGAAVPAEAGPLPGENDHGIISATRGRPPVAEAVPVRRPPHGWPAVSGR